MRNNLIISILLLTFLQQSLHAQQETYIVTKALFSSPKYDEYSPVFYRHGIVFTSNSGSGTLVDYSSATGKTTFDIKFVDTTEKKMTWRSPKLFSKNLITPFNDGPACFNRTGDTIYFSRNLQVSGNYNELSSPRNKLGIFSAVYDGEKWTKIREMRFNNEWYNVTCPWLSPDGKKLYFACDKTGGYGGSDLYYSQWKGDYWSDPVNLGPVINTEGNEAFPFISSAGDLYFASDGHPGSGGKDIFYSKLLDSVWLKPIPLDSPVNSKYDDFGIIIDSTMNSGYFSSNRDGSLDIFKFRTDIPQIFYSTIQKENSFCFKFNDDGKITIDNNFLKYEWDFGDGSKITGQDAEHCFPGPGNYTVKLNFIDSKTNKEIFTKLIYNIELKDIEQPYISSPEIAVKGELVDFDGLKSNLPGCDIITYVWDFGDDGRAKGPNVKVIFKEKGIKEVKLGLIVKNEKTGIIYQSGVLKKVSVFDTKQEALSFEAKGKESAPLINIREYDKALIKTIYSAENEMTTDAVFLVELMTSKTRLITSGPTFKKIPPRYTVREIFLTDEKSYVYVVDSEMDLMATMPAFNEMISLGFKNSRIITYLLKDPAEKEIHNLKKIFGMSADIYFDNYGRLTSTAYLVLDQMVRILNKYPDIKIEINVHTDNNGSPQNNLTQSQSRAKLLVDYLADKNIDAKRLFAKGNGGERPIATNSTEAGKRLNRRVDITVIRDINVLP